MPHEVEGRWKWPDWGRGTHDVLSSIMLGPPFRGYLELDGEVDGESWHIKVSYSKSGSNRDCRTGSTSNGSTNGIS